MHYLHQRKEMGSLWGGPFFTPRSYFAAVGDIGGAKGNNHANRIFCRRGYKPRQLYMLVNSGSGLSSCLPRISPGFGQTFDKKMQKLLSHIRLALWWWITLKSISKDWIHALDLCLFICRYLAVYKLRPSWGDRFVLALLLLYPRYVRKSARAKRA